MNLTKNVKFLKLNQFQLTSTYLGMFFKNLL
jgi:hypothetical protein